MSVRKEGRETADSVPKQQDVSDGQVVGVRQRQRRSRCAERTEAFCGAAVEGQARRAVPAHDFNIPLMSLPLVFNTTLDTIPSGTYHAHLAATDAAGNVTYQDVTVNVINIVLETAPVLALGSFVRHSPGRLSESLPAVPRLVVEHEGSRLASTAGIQRVAPSGHARKSPAVQAPKKVRPCHHFGSSK